MKCLFTYLRVCLSVAVLIMATVASVPAKSKDVNIFFKNDKISADLINTPLNQVLIKIEKEKKIWFKGKEELLNKNISLNFKPLPVQEGLKRILSHLNYSFIFNKNKNLEGIMIFGEGKETQGKTASGPGGKSKMSPRASQPGPMDMTQMRVVKNSPPPGDELVKPGAKKQFKVIKNSPPPGDKPSVAKKLEHMKVIKSVDPPGGPVDNDSEKNKMRDFVIIENCPPPCDKKSKKK